MLPAPVEALFHHRAKLALASPLWRNTSKKGLLSCRADSREHGRPLGYRGSMLHRAHLRLVCKRVSVSVVFSRRWGGSSRWAAASHQHAASNHLSRINRWKAPPTGAGPSLPGTPAPSRIAPSGNRPDKFWASSVRVQRRIHLDPCFRSKTLEVRRVRRERPDEVEPFHLAIRSRGGLRSGYIFLPSRRRRRVVRCCLLL